MKATKISNVDEYIASQPANVQSRLKQIRQAVKKAAPAADEVLSYGMPAYKYNGMLLYFAAHTHHIGFYPFTTAIAAFAKELSKYHTSKGTVQFPNDQPIPLPLISKLVKFRIKENEEKAALKKKTKSTAVKKTAPKKTAGKSSDEDLVNEWLNKQPENIREDVNAVRKIIRSASSKLNERIKWNAPSYYYKEDIVTFGPYRNNSVLLVFHHPLIVKIKSDLLEGNYKDRRLLYLRSKQEIKKTAKEVQRILKELLLMMEK